MPVVLPLFDFPTGTFYDIDFQRLWASIHPDLIEAADMQYDQCEELLRRFFIIVCVEFNTHAADIHITSSGQKVLARLITGPDNTLTEKYREYGAVWIT